MDISSRTALVPLALVLSVGAVSALCEFATVISHSGPLPYERTGNSLLVDSRPTAVTQRSARDIPDLLQTLLRDNDDKGGSQGDLIFSSKYDVYLDENRLVYVNRSCNREEEGGMRSFLHVYPLYQTDLPQQHKQYGFENLDFQWRHGDWKGDGNCIVARRLPNYKIARIRTGQYNLGGDQVWKEEFPLGE